ncbi:U6 snrna phosphodiesterase, partial [Globisporangium splendens]
MKRGRVLVERKRKTARQRVEESEDDDEQVLSDSDEEVQPTARSQGSSARTNASSSRDDGEEVDDEEEEEEEDGMLDFTQPDYALQLSESQPADTQESSEKTKANAMPARVGQMSTKTIEDLSALLVRYMLYKASLKLPIKFADISKDVFPKHKNISRYFFQKAKQQLESVFGYRVVAVDDSSSKELYIVLNAQTSQEHLLLMNKTGKSASRGFLMMILGLLWCAPARRISEDDLWKQLALLDSSIKPTRDHAALGDVANLLKTFETQFANALGSGQSADPQFRMQEMDAIVACYESSSESSGVEEEEHVASSSDSEDDSDAGGRDDGAVGQKRKRGSSSEPPQWTRAFPHVDGNWPSHVSITISADGAFRSLCSKLVERVTSESGVELVPMGSGGDDAHHLSLSRPFVLTYDQIEPFVDELHAALKWRRRFSLSLHGATILCNDDKTRSFLALRVVNGHKEVLNILKCVDKCMRQFAQPMYYEDPIPHVSIASAFGDSLATQVTQDQVHKVLLSLDEREPWNTVITTVHVAIGNKQFRIPLQ